MKNLLLATVGLVALVGMAAPASAADMAVKAGHPPPVLAPIYDWTGFYIGANGGWGQSRNCWDFVDVAGVVVADGCRERSGGLAGGQIGYRWQASQWVFGVEAQGDWADLSNHARQPDQSCVLHSHQDRWLSASSPARSATRGTQALFYVKGGAAVTSNRFSILDTLTGVEFASASATRWGGTVGVGFEYGFAPNWSFGVEYNHLFMGDANNSFSVVNPVLRRFCQQPDQPGRRHGHRAPELPFRRLRGAIRGPLLILSPANYSPGAPRRGFLSPAFSRDT